MNFFKTRSFKFWETGLLKICMISLGILLGVYFYNYLAALIWLWWLLFVGLTVYFLVYFMNK